MTYRSSSDLLTLHAVRLTGFADTGAVARRFALDPAAVTLALQAGSSAGWVTRSTFTDLTGWSLTEAGRRENERQLEEELDRADARGTVTAVHEDFLPLNSRVASSLTAVQLAPGDAPAHEHAWQGLTAVAAELRDLESRLTARLSRFARYHARFATAVFRADEDPDWLTSISVDSCHRVWFELHEDLIATLGLPR
jgi:hypothetical protein